MANETGSGAQAQHLLANFLSAWNARDWNACVANMVEDASIVGVTGEMRVGREDIREAYAKYLPALPDDQLLHDIQVHSIRQATPDAVVIDARLMFANQPMAATMVCISRHGEWRISDWRAFRVLTAAQWDSLKAPSTSGNPA